MDLDTALYNKSKILQGLKNASVSRMKCQFWGDEDSGEIDDFEFYGLDGLALPGAPEKLKNQVILFKRKQGSPKIEGHGLAVYLFSYWYLLDQKNPGWADGSKGTIEFNAEADLISVRLKKKRARQYKSSVF